MPIIFYDYGKKLSWKKIFNFKKTVESLKRINAVKLILTLVMTKNDLWDFFLGWVGGRGFNKILNFLHFLGRPEYTVPVNYYGHVEEENGKRKWVNTQV